MEKLFVNINTVPNARIYSNSNFKIIVSVGATSYFEKIKFVICIIGFELYQKESPKTNKKKFFKQKIDEKVISIMPNSQMKYTYPFSLDKPKLPSSFISLILSQKFREAFNTK